MLFNSYPFLFIFLPLTLACYLASPIERRNLVLTGAGYLFYGYWNAPFCVLLLALTSLSYTVGKEIFLSKSTRKRRLMLIGAIAINIIVLVYFKYANFLLESLATILPSAHLPVVHVILPIGISFYVFENISYLVDLFRGQTTPARSLIDYACFVALFPHLLAGPIVRFQQIRQQIQERRLSVDQFASGVERFIIGLSKKVLLADTAASIADPLFSLATPGMVSVWLAITAFSLQIYFDFSGYSDMAIGLARMFGFTLPENFNYPYQALGVSDFWRRWHMSLSLWLRDYAYIPLGGSRVPWPRLALNILLTMLICGLWHGAVWTYVLWGGYFGILLVMERPLRPLILRMNRMIVIPCTYLLVLMGWILFKANSVAQAWLWLSCLIDFTNFTPSQLSQMPIAKVTFIGGTQLACWLWPQELRITPALLPLWQTAVVFMFLASTLVILGQKISPFLYYQF